MCTDITEHATLTGSAKGPQGWFTAASAEVAYDHPTHATVEHAIMVSVRDGDADGQQRVAVELDRSSARDLARALLRAADAADDYEGDR